VNIAVRIAGQPVSFTGKGFFDVDSRNRLDSNLYMLSVAFKF
jgi:hypothetical protein